MFKIIGAMMVYAFAIFGLVKALEGRASAQSASCEKEGAVD